MSIFVVEQVVLPEGSKDIEVSAPFPTQQQQEVKYSHLDIVGRPVVVLEKPDVIPEHNLYFQVYYRFQHILAQRAVDADYWFLPPVCGLYCLHAY